MWAVAEVSTVKTRAQSPGEESGYSIAAMGSPFEGFIKGLSYIAIYTEISLWTLCGGCTLHMSFCVRALKNKVRLDSLNSKGMR